VHTGGVGDTPAELLVPANGSYGLGNAAEGDRLPLPAIKAKDAVGFRDHLPTLLVTHAAAALLSLADIGPIQRSGECSELLGGEARGLGRLGLKGLRSRC